MTTDIKEIREMRRGLSNPGRQLFPFVFPRTKFVDQNGLVAQVEHIATEQAEIEEAILTTDIWHTAEEMMDKYHSLETGLRILQEKYGVDLVTLRRMVEMKNHNRGYYDVKE